MFPDREAWDLACELARSGDYDNIVTIERELRRRNLLVHGAVTDNTYWREYLTRLCHSSRDGRRHIEDHERRERATFLARPIAPVPIGQKS